MFKPDDGDLEAGAKDEPHQVATCARCAQPIFYGRGDYNRYRGEELHTSCLAKVLRPPEQHRKETGT